jgi:methyltransferase
LFVGYTIALRLFELNLSQRNNRALLKRGFERKDSLTSYLCMVAVHVAWIFGLVIEPLIHPHEPPRGLQVSCIVVFAALQLLRWWTIRTLGEFWNVRVMAPKADADLDYKPVRTGPYVYLRHPNYFVVVLELATLPLMGGAYVTAAIGSIGNAAVLIHRVRTEDSWLLRSSVYRNHFFGPTEREL